MAGKAINRVLPKPRKHWVGDGFHVYPAFADLAFTSALSPFLMFDYAAPKEFPPSSGKPKGVGQHPHRGFETVTVALQGEIEHADSTGGRDVIKQGDVQWMTAGRGIIHEEFISKEMTRAGGVLEMMQLWVNLPSKHKMAPPKYQALLAKSIPSTALSKEGGTVRVIAGDFEGVKGPAETFTPINMWQCSLPPVGQWAQISVPEGHNTIVFVIRGEVAVQADRTRLVEGQVAVLEQAGTALRVAAMQDESTIMILTGEPIDEPIAAMGPFVMNTQAELAQANDDYRRGKMGR